MRRRPTRIAPETGVLSLPTRLGDLHPAPYNPRSIGKPTAEALAASIEEFGDIAQLTFNLRTGQLVAGHQRLAALSEHGDLPIEMVDDQHGRITLPDGTVFMVRYVDWPLEKEKAANLTANNPYLTGEFTKDAFALLQETERAMPGIYANLRLPELLKDLVKQFPEEPPPPNSVPAPTEPPANPVSQPGELFELGPHFLVCGDATDPNTVASLMHGEKADCVFTSPPYAVGIDYGSYQDTLDNLRKLLRSCAALWLEHVVPGGFAVLNFNDIVAGREAAQSEEPCEYPMALEYWPVFREFGYSLWSRRVWCKPNPRVHSPWCRISNRAASDWEHVWTWKTPGSTILSRIDGATPSQNGWIDTTKEEGVEVGKEIHGAGMATSIAYRMIGVHSRPRSIVYEPFCGTGTTLIAANQAQRLCRASELSPAFCDVIRKRWTTYAKQNNLEVGSGGLE